MALISTLDIAGTTHPTRGGGVVVPTYRFFELDWAKALTAKGSALAAADVIEVIDLPAGSVVLHAGAFVKVASNATTLTVGVGYGGATSAWVAALNGNAAVGTYGTDIQPPLTITFPTFDTIDVILTTQTGTLSTGKIVVYALIGNIADRFYKPGLAQLKS